jgi:hypothetical protein
MFGSQECGFERRPASEGGAIQTGTQKTINRGEVLRINWSHSSITVRSVSVAALTTVVRLLR